MTKEDIIKAIDLNDSRDKLRDLLGSDSGSDIDFIPPSSSDSDVGLESDPLPTQKKRKKKTNNFNPSKQIRLFNTNGHCKPVHEGKKQFICKTCSASFSLKLDLDKHITSVHENKKPNFDCISSVHEEKRPDSGSDIFLFSSSSDSDVGLESDPFLKQKKEN